MAISDLSITEVKDLVNNSPIKNLVKLLELIEQDERKGIRNLHSTILRKIKVEEDRLKRKSLLLKKERKLWTEGCLRLGGIDEAGRGPLAGPVVAACVIFNPHEYIEGVDDSKKLSPAKREMLFKMIMDQAVAVGIGCVDAGEIDRVKILNATRIAMEKAASKCSPYLDFLLVDAMEGQFPVPYLSIVKGDTRSHSIAAASIIAKVTRDREMLKWHKIYPQYNFCKHKGYGTADHIEAIREYGLCPIHRRTFTHRLI
ncbi:MAG: ribonuclease HII [Clostridiales bacterium]|nr:ribonuclease HII [Clostridiales bacterium]